MKTNFVAQLKRLQKVRKEAAARREEWEEKLASHRWWRDSSVLKKLYKMNIDACKLLIHTTDLQIDGILKDMSQKCAARPEKKSVR